MLVTAAIIAGISFASFSSMRFLQDKISYLTVKSTPLQVQTIALQRDLHGCSAALAKVNTAETMGDYMAFRVEAETFITSIENAEKSLPRLSGNSLQVANDLNEITQDFFESVEERILSSIAASQAHEKASQQMRESSLRLAELERLVRTLQATHAASFAQSLENTRRLATRLHNLEELRDLTTELGSASIAVQSAQNSTAFRIAQAKVRTILGRIARIPHDGHLSPSLASLAVDTDEYLQLRSAAITKANTDAPRWAQESHRELVESMNRLSLVFKQEIELTSSKQTIETGSQQRIFAQANSANDILMSNSGLAKLSLTLTDEIGRLFAIDSAENLHAADSRIRILFATTFEHIRQMEKSLGLLNAAAELKMLRAAAASLAAIRSELYSANGIFVTLRNKLKAAERSKSSDAKLHAMIIKYSRQGNNDVSIAQTEQNKSVAAVNSMVNQSLSRIVFVASLAIAIGTFFGFWIYRSVLMPLRLIRDAVIRQREQGNEKACLAEAVAGGDLDRDVTVSEAITLDATHSRHDEMWMVLNAVVGMSEAQVTLDKALSGMTTALRLHRDEELRRDHHNSGLYELNKILQIERNPAELAEKALTFMATFLEAGVGVIYLYDEGKNKLNPFSTYAFSRSGRLSGGVSPGEGLVGQVARERKMIFLDSVPADYLPISSALGKADPPSVIIAPIVHNDTLIGVLELGRFSPFGEDDRAFLLTALEDVAIAINISRSHQLVNVLLEQTQAQAEELRVQQEELQQSNEELIERTHMLMEYHKTVKAS